MKKRCEVIRRDVVAPRYSRNVGDEVLVNLTLLRVVVWVVQGFLAADSARSSAHSDCRCTEWNDGVQLEGKDCRASQRNNTRERGRGR